MTVDWSQGVCHDYDPEIFFTPADEAFAVSVCYRCPIMAQCRNYAISKPEKFGVWGGLTEDDRRRVGWRKHRVRCPSCGGTGVDQSLHRVEVCRTCGLSWPV